MESDRDGISWPFLEAKLARSRGCEAVDAVGKNPRSYERGYEDAYRDNRNASAPYAIS